MSATIQQSKAVADVLARKRAPRTSITVSTDVDVDIEEFDDDAILARAAEINKERGGLPDDCVNVSHMAQSAYLAHLERNPREFDRLAREIVGEIVGKIL